MCLRILDLQSQSYISAIVGSDDEIGRMRESKETDFNFEKVFWGPVDLFKALLASIWHGLHNDREAPASNLQ